MLGTAGSFRDTLFAPAAEPDAGLAPLWEGAFAPARDNRMDQALANRLAAPLPALLDRLLPAR